MKLATCWGGELGEFALGFEGCHLIGKAAGRLSAFDNTSVSRVGQSKACIILCGWLLYCKSYLCLAFCQKQSCVRPVRATHIAAGPDGFHQPSPIPQIEQQAFWTKQEASWF